MATYALYSLHRCCSSVGRIANYVQQVSLGHGCVSLRIVVHEIGHLIGFWHEQSRPDRDKYIIIHSQNIDQGKFHNFRKYSTNDIDSLGVPYDFSSVMHYHKYAFTINGSVTISSKEKDIPFGGAPELSPLDIKQINLLYKDQCG